MLTCFALLTYEKRPCLSIAPWLLVVMQLGELVVLPDQFVGPVVFVGDGNGPPGGRGYVPAAVVGVVTAVLVGREQRLKTVGLSNRVVRGSFPDNCITTYSNEKHQSLQLCF